MSTISSEARQPIRTENVDCLVCGSTKSELSLAGLKDCEYGVPGVYQLRRCAICEQMFLSPRPVEEDLLHCYPTDYHGYHTSGFSSIYGALASWQIKSRFMHYRSLLGDKPANILDVGCGDGSVLKAIMRHYPKWRTFGVEFKPEIAGIGRTEGLMIFTGTLEECDFPEKYFDLLIMNHLIEHLSDPLRAMRKACALLKPGGHIVGEVPNYDSIDRRISGKWWGGHHAPRHLFQFTPKTITNLFASAGLQTVKISPEMHTGHWALSFQNFFQAHGMAVRLRNGRAFYYPLLLVLCVVFNLLQYPFNKTGIMSFIAKRPTNS